MQTEFNDKLDRLGIKYCFNNQKYDLSILKFIIVGDNPGINEYKENKFFVGNSGKELRKHFNTNDLTNDFDTECIVFNKTFIHTAKTEELENIVNQVGKIFFENIQLYCASEIAKISNEHNLPILIFGKSKLGPNLLFDSFWKAINQLVDKKENILVFNHPSYDNFFIEWNKYKNILNYNSAIDLLKQIGSNNTTLINKKYSHI